MKTSWLSLGELHDLGIKFLPAKIDELSMPKISRFARLYNPENIYVAQHVRIDDFCVVSAGKGESGRIELKGYNHISVGACLYGGAGIFIGEHVQVSVQSILLSESDNMDGDHLIGAMYPDALRDVRRGAIKLDDFSTVLAGCVVLPGAHLMKGSILGANSLLGERRILAPWTIHGGTPARYLKDRARRMEHAAQQLRQSGDNGQ